MKEKKISGKTPAQQQKKKENLFFSIHSLGLIYAHRRVKLQKYLNYLQYRKGILGKITKGGQKSKKSRKVFSHPCEFSHPYAKLLHFPSFSTLLSF